MRGSSSAEYSTQTERTEMTLKYCQSHKCHTYDTKDRKRGSKGNRKNQTRRRSDFYYGGGNFCSQNCYNDWASDFMDRAIDQVSGRIVEPITLTEENAWQKRYRLIGARVVVMTWDIFGLIQLLKGKYLSLNKSLILNHNHDYSFICP